MTRMAEAMKLAEKSWASAMKQEPEFVERYLELAEQLLLSKPKVSGDEFKEYCMNNSLFRPLSLHSNVWVSGVRALNKIGWTIKIGDGIPTKSHNHMPQVSLWLSNIYFDKKYDLPNL